MRGPRQQMTGLSKEATLDRERESGGKQTSSHVQIFNTNTQP